jgi:AcrR family transcriptional regulator
VPRVLTETDIAGFRERLCELATRIYVERGPDNFNMRLLAAELGVSAMTPYRYFKDKDEILSAIRARAFNRFADQLERSVSGAGSPPEKSMAVGKAYMRWRNRPASGSSSISASGGAHRSPNWHWPKPARKPP